MYVKDTALYCNINQNIGEELINAELMKLREWLDAIKLSLIIAKTKYMVFHTSKRKVIYLNLKVNNNIERVAEYNVLGVISHSHMKWNKHINYISMKIARSIISILYRHRNIYTESVLVTIYNTLILPHFHYCLLLWGSVVKRKTFSTSALKESSKKNYQ